MNASRLVAAAASLAIGFGITLVGVAAGGDEIADSGDTPELDGTTPADGSAEQEEFEAEVPEDADVDEASPDTDPDPAPNDSVDDPDPTTATTPPRTGDTAPTEPNPPRSTAVPDFSEVLCVETVSVLLANDTTRDFVVLDSDGASLYLVFSTDGPFEISRDDDSVVQIFELRRDVEFFEGAPINFFDTCDDLDPWDPDDSLSGESADNDPVIGGAPASLDFPCSAEAQDTLRRTLDRLGIEPIDDLDEVILVLAFRLAEVGGREPEAFFGRLETEFVGFREFGGGCPDPVESGFTPSGIFCAAARISADGALFDYLSTVVPNAMTTCTYDLDQNGEF